MGQWRARLLFSDDLAELTFNSPISGGRSQDDSGIGQGDHFLRYKFIERTFEHWANFTKQLTASRRHQAPRKAAHHLRNEVGQNTKDKKRDNRASNGHPSWVESHNRGSFQTPGNPLTGGSGGSFQISEGNLNGRKNKQNPEITCLKATASRKSTPDSHICHQQVGVEWREAGGIA